MVTGGTKPQQVLLFREAVRAFRASSVADSQPPQFFHNRIIEHTVGICHTHWNSAVNLCDRRNIVLQFRCALLRCQFRQIVVVNTVDSHFMTGIEFRTLCQIQPVHFQHIPVYPCAAVVVQSGVDVKRGFHAVAVQDLQQLSVLLVAVVIAECQGFSIVIFPVHWGTPLFVRSCFQINLLSLYHLQADLSIPSVFRKILAPVPEQRAASSRSFRKKTNFHEFSRTYCRRIHNMLY